MEILRDSNASFEVWLAQDVRRPRVLLQLREDPEVRALAERLARDLDNQAAMARLVEDALSRCVPVDTLAERFAELVYYGLIVVRERSQDFYPLPDPYRQPATALVETAANESEPLAPAATQAVTPSGPPTAEELGFTSDSITDRARARELADVVAYYSRSEIRDDVRDRVWADIRDDPNKLATMMFMIGEADTLPTPQELQSIDGLADKAKDDVRDVIEDAFKKIGGKLRGIGR
ncbi:MAG: hypothetical protein K0V04_02490 [Deltaproteobacteria bacterium]|nr:hypothetical protein [Deltaproteobacteria bacterium]